MRVAPSFVRYTIVSKHSPLIVIPNPLISRVKDLLFLSRDAFFADTDVAPRNKQIRPLRRARLPSMLSYVKAMLLRVFTSIAFISICALGFRVAYMVHESRLIPSEVLATVPFQNEAGNIAQALAQGDRFCCLFRQPTGPTAWLAPAYPFLLSKIFRAFGTFTLTSFYVAAFLNSIFSALACIPLFLAGKRLNGSLLAAVAAWIWALFPSGIIMPFQWIWETSLSALLAATLLWLTLRLADTLKTRDWLLYGGVWGLALLTNPALSSLLPFFLAWIAYEHIRGVRKPWKSLSVAVLTILAICLPWAVRNAVQFRRLIPMRDNFPFELWIGNNDIYDQESRQVNRITRFEQVRLYQKQGESAFLDEKWAKAKEFIRAKPKLFVQLCGRRVVSTWLGTDKPLAMFAGADSPLVRFLLIWNVLTIVGSVAGIARLLWNHSRHWFPLAVFPIVFPLVYYLTQTSLRLRHPCDPILALLLACAVAYQNARVDLAKA